MKREKSQVRDGPSLGSRRVTMEPIMGERIEKPAKARREWERTTIPQPGQDWHASTMFREYGASRTPPRNEPCKRLGPSPQVT